ncbi:helix-turn-helix domain-containing protein [uncultured Draconibacterium sp.]|uniref:helix-turn-helix domain-containing protein n=1 Tax=uncultured Draconibacterium sp. TaxID=1573823 RepID=UPI0025F2EBD1|nr:helix-turn-helix domain-containing protein [uncultured Draconibacterium sp.]
MEKIIVITEQDFVKFKEELLNEVKALFDNNIQKKKWIRSKDVREMLGISDSTLQTLRINGTIPAYKLDSTWFYKYDEILEVMENSRVN